MDLRIDPIPDDGPVRLPEPLPFGRIFTRRMFTERWDAERGWPGLEFQPSELAEAGFGQIAYRLPASRKNNTKKKASCYT